ncbi:MAG: DNA repair and recombination protein RadB [Candidatus Woesearchaeota archaeon]
MAISTGFGELDALLAGGYETDIVTTIYGPAGSGKTTLCILAAANTGRTKKVIYIDTENNFSIERLKQIAPDYEKFFENILLLKPGSFSEQKSIFKQLCENYDERVGLIIIDTIVMLYRVERCRANSYELSTELGLQVTCLGGLARKKNVPVIMTSQVYTNLQNETKMVGGDLIGYASKCVIELQNFNNLHRLILKKHRSVASNTMDYKISSQGFTPR